MTENDNSTDECDRKNIENEFHQAAFNLAEEYDEKGIDNATLASILQFASDHQKGIAESKEYIGALIRLERDIYERCREADDEIPAYEIYIALREVAEMYRYKGQNRSLNSDIEQEVDDDE